MFKKSETDDRRVRIIDVTHMFYKYANGGMPSLSASILVDGQYRQVDTTLPSGVIKAIHRWSRQGYNPTVVCFDSKGCSRSRKMYFSQHKDRPEQKAEYKGKRDVQDSRFYEGINLTMNLLTSGGVTVLKADGYEADDLIKAAVDKAKIDYPNLPIDVITGDADLIPLVDDQVSVYIASRKLTWAESSNLEITHYFQLRPYNYQEYCEGLTAFKSLTVPYNTVLLTKLLRGDKSDNIDGYPKFTPTKYKKLIQQMQEDNVDMADLFRYDAPIKTYVYRGTDEPIPLSLLDETPKEKKAIKYLEPPKLTQICNVLSKYLDEDIVSHARFVYNGINLNGAFVDVPDNFKRRPATITSPIKGYVSGELVRAVSIVQINLPIG